MPRVFLAWAALAIAAAAQTAPRAFDSVTVRLNRDGQSSAGKPRYPTDGYWYAVNIHLVQLISFAYEVPPPEVYGLPASLTTLGFDMQAHMPAATGNAEFNEMLRTLLADHFHLRAHRATKSLNAHLLTAAPGGPRLTPAAGRCGADVFPNLPPDDNRRHCGTVMVMYMVGDTAGLADNVLMGWSVGTADLARALSGYPSRIPVVDETGLTGLYDLNLVIPGAARSPSDGWEVTLQKELGLRLDLSQTVKRDIPVIQVDNIVWP